MVTPQCCGKRACGRIRLHAADQVSTGPGRLNLEHITREYAAAALALRPPKPCRGGFGVADAFAPNPSNPMESEMLPIDQVFRTVQLQCADKNRWRIRASQTVASVGRALQDRILPRRHPGQRRARATC